MGTAIIQPSLSGGELSNYLAGRVDLARYQNSLKLCRNWIVRATGGLSNRPGTRFMGEVQDSTKRSRLIPFAFSTTQTYALEFGNQKLRFFSNGAQVLDTGVPYEIDTPYLEADLPLLHYTQSADVLTLVHPSYPPYQLERHAALDWTLTAMDLSSGPFQDINSDSTKTVIPDGTTGTVNLVASSPIFLSEHVNHLMKLSQIDFGKPWNAGKTVTVGTIQRSGGRYYTSTSAGTTGVWAPINTIGKWYDGGVYWEYVHSGFGVVQIQSVAGDGLSAVASVLSVLPDSLVVGAGSGAVNISSLAVLPFFNIGIVTSSAHGLAVNDWVNFVVNYLDTLGHAQVAYFSSQVQSVSSSTGFIAGSKGSVVLPGFASLTGTSTVAKNASTPSYLWAFGEFNDTRGYAQSACYHQQRLAFAGSPATPQGIWMSRTNAFGDFSESAPVQDDDSLTFKLASNQVNSVQNLISLGQLLALASDGEWVVGGSASSGPLTPTSLSATMRGYYGSSTLPALPTGKTALYVQDKGQSVREVVHDFAYGYDSYSGSDLSVFASHLFEGFTLVEWCYQNVPTKTVWCVRSDGILLGMTYDPEQQIAAWHQHETDGLFESVCCISEGNEDVVYAVVNRTINGSTYRSVERMESRLISDPMAACFMDSAISFDGRNTGSTTITVSGGTTWDNTDTVTLTASASTFVSGDVNSQIVFVDAAGIAYRMTITAYMSATVVHARPERLIPVAYRSAARTDWAWARLTFSGAVNLKAKAISVLADGNVVSNPNLDASPITVDSSGTFTLAYPAYRVTAGLPYVSDIQTLNVNIPSQETTIDKYKAIPVVRMLVDKSCPLFVGRDFDHLDEQKIRYTEGYDEPTNLLTGLGEVTIQTGFEKDGSIAIRNNYPLPSTILSLIPELTVAGS